MEVILKDKITGNPAFVKCAVFKREKVKGTQSYIFRLICSKNVVYSSDKDVLVNRLTRKTKLKGIDRIEVELIKEW